MAAILLSESTELARFSKIPLTLCSPLGILSSNCLISFAPNIRILATLRSTLTLNNKHIKNH